MNKWLLKVSVLFFSAFFLLPYSAKAQNAIISPSTGHLLAGLGLSAEQFFEYGWKSLWWHNQLPLKLWISDHPEMTPERFPRSQGCNFSYYKNTSTGEESIVAACVNEDCQSYITASLPDGYRFTGYELTLVNDLPTSNVNGLSLYRQNEWNFYETGADFDTDNAYQSTTLGSTSSSTEYTIRRNSQQKGDMGSTLYFVFHGNNTWAANRIAIVRIKRFVIYFAADDNVTSVMRPQEVDDEATSYREVDFATGKVALGDIRKRKREGGSNEHFAYEYHEVEELDANMLLYNEGSVTDGSVKSVPSAATITQEVQNNGTAQPPLYYGLKNGTYYIETPTEVVTTHGNHDPVGYRITEAKLHYNYGTAQPAVTENVVHNENMFTISAELPIDGDAANGTMTYYLHPSGRFVRAQSGETTTKLWQRDDQGRIYHYQDGEYTFLEYNPNTSPYTIRVYSTTTDAATTYTTYNSRYGYGRRVQSGYSSTTTFYNSFNIAGNNSYNLRFGSTSSYHYVQAQWNSDLAAYKVAQSTSPGSNSVKMFSASTTKAINQPAYTPQPWTLTVYDKDGSTPVETVEVSPTNSEGTVTLTGFNNDAVKFEVSGLQGDDARALFTAEVTMQPLNPYLSSLDIVCENNLKDDPNVPEEQKREVLTVAAEDFSIHGGTFEFPVPATWSSVMPCTFSFQNLHTHYLDNTYYGNTGSTEFARNVLVGSEYYGHSADGNDVVAPNLYDISEPAVSGDAVDYTKKIHSMLCGTQPFYFTNADELDHDIATNEIRTLHQYRFTLDRYRSQQLIERQTASGATIYTGARPGEFHKLTFDKDDSKVAYLFVADEPRYNIAPTRGTQHRLHAFYDMEIQLITRDYNPVYTWTKIYDDIAYANSSVTEKSQWGLTISTEHAANEEPGYLPISKISDDVTAAVNSSNGTDCPTSLDQILYIDASPLATIIYSDNVSVKDNDMVSFRKKLAPNSLFYLPVDMELFADNFAYKTGSGTFQACNNIVLSDRKPFFAPYDIRVEDPNYASYSRGITAQSYSTTNYGTLLLPFALSLNDEGIHIDDQGRSAFSLFEMNASNALSINKSDLNSGAVGYFSKLQSTKLTHASEANVPYLFEVTQKTDNPTTTLIAKQKGTIIKATPTESTLIDKKTAGTSSNKYTATGKIGSTTYYLTHTGSYSGAVIPKAQGVFYMAQGKFLNTLSLNSGLDALNMLPFRSWYTCKTSSGNVPLLAQIFIDFGDNPDIPTDIKTTHAGNGLYIEPGQGMLTMLADSNVAVDIYSIDGTHVRQLSLSAGQQHVEYIPAGGYVVNQQKVIVR